jgi:fatty acyl-CoA reductase
LKVGAVELRKVANRLDGMYDIFEFFINGEWIYINDRIYQVINRLSDEEKVEFDCDVNNIVWDEYLQHYVRGMLIWVLKQDLVEPS